LASELKRHRAKDTDGQFCQFVIIAIQNRGFDFERKGLKTILRMLLLFCQLKLAH